MIELPCLELHTPTPVPVHYCSVEQKKSAPPSTVEEGDKKGWTQTLTEENKAHRFGNPLDAVTYGHTLEQVQRYSKGSKGTLLEVGSSAGHFIQKIKEQQEQPALLIGSDYIQGNCATLAQKFPGTPFISFDLVNSPLKKESIDCVVSLHVLEHIKEDQQAVQSIYDLLKPGGIAVIEVPAGSTTYDISDAYYLHYRRYDMQQLCSLFHNAGFEILEKNYLGVLDYPLHWLRKQWGRYQYGVTQYQENYTEEQRNLHKQVAQQRSHYGKTPGRIENFFDGAWFKRGLYSVESWLRKSITFPFGARCSITCRKKESVTQQ